MTPGPHGTFRHDDPLGNATVDMAMPLDHSLAIKAILKLTLHPLEVLPRSQSRRT
jgi:hypothetical protein